MKKSTLKPIVVPRNRFVAAALFMKAGSHRKSTKALRKQQKQSHWGHNSMVE